MYRLFELMIEIAGWLMIAASPLLVGTGIGILVYVSNPTRERLAVAICLAVLGMIIGIIWATKIGRKKGTMRFISRISGTPDLDEKLKDENK